MYSEELTEKIIGCAYTVANTLGNGFLEKVYENALAHELKKQNLQVEQQKAIPVYYDQAVVGEYVADLLVENIHAPCGARVNDNGYKLIAGAGSGAWNIDPMDHSLHWVNTLNHPIDVLFSSSSAVCACIAQAGGLEGPR